MERHSTTGLAAPQRSWILRLTRTRIWLLAGAFSILSVVIKEVMFLLLAHDVGARDERYFAEAIYAIVMGVLLAKFLDRALEVHRAALARAEVTAEMNHHVRNALQVIIFQCRQANMPEDAVAKISESLRRVDWALREVLPRNEPVPLEFRQESLYQWSHPRGAAGE